MLDHRRRILLDKILLNRYTMKMDSGRIALLRFEETQQYGV